MQIFSRYLHRHIVQKFLSIRQRIHSKRLRILNTLWSDFWIGVTFTSQTSSSLPHLCDNKKFPDSILERHSSLLLFSYSRVKTYNFKNEAKRAGEKKKFKILLFLHWPRRKGFVNQNFISPVARGLF